LVLASLGEKESEQQFLVFKSKTGEKRIAIRAILFEVLFDEVRIFSKSLSPGEILEIYNEVNSQFHPADQDQDCQIGQAELIDYIGKWYSDSSLYPLSVMMEGIGHYYAGSYC